MHARLAARLFVAIALSASFHCLAPLVRGAAATTTTLALASGGVRVATVTSGAVVTLTAVVRAGAARVTRGQVNFCDASATYCTDIHLLGSAQLTSAGTAVYRFRPGIGSHSYKAVFVATNIDAGSTSTASGLRVTGKNPTTTTLASGGSPGNYSLTATVTGVGGMSPPTRSVSFLDTSNGNAVLRTGPLASGQSALDLLISQTLPTSQNPQSSVTGDFNGDGIPDLAFVDGNYFDGLPGAVTILIGNGDGTFKPGTTLATGNTPWGIAIGDFNGDGKADLAATNGGDNTLSIFLGNGDGTFTSVASMPKTEVIPQAIAVGDFNGDGIQDLAVVNYWGAAYTPVLTADAGTVSILLGNGDGTFSPVAATPAVGGEPLAIVAADLNGDGKTDLVVANANWYVGPNGTSAPGTLTVLLGNGDGTFSPGTTPVVGYGPDTLSVGDFNGDGKLDIAVGYGQQLNVSILLGNGDGTFASAPDAILAGNAASIGVADFNGDGKADLAVASSGFNSSYVLLGNGDGTFTTAASLPYTALLAGPLSVADFNGDGFPDIVEANANNSGATVLLTALNQTATATVTGVAITGTGIHNVDASYPGDPNYSPSLSATVPLQAQQTPVLTWPTPAAITYGTPLSAAQLDASAAFGGISLAGSYVYSPALGTVLSAGTNTLTVTFTPTDSTDYATVTRTVTLVVRKAVPVITWQTPAQITYGTPLGPIQLDPVASVPCTFVYSPAAGTILNAGIHPITVTCTPVDATDYTSVSKTVIQIVRRAAPVITWATPAPISQGTALSATQLDATSAVAGTFAYAPPAGTVLPSGTQTLSVTFTPTDIADYTRATASVQLAVNPQGYSVSWAAPAAITYGTPLSAAQLNATATIPGTFAYTPAAGTMLTAGAHTLSVTFTPTNTALSPNTTTVQITVNQATPAITWTPPTAISYGTPLGAAQLDATSTVAGTFAYTPAAGTVLTAGVQTLSVTFTPTDAVDYKTASATVQVSVSPLSPVITWPAPSAISFGTALSSTQLDATTVVPGTFVYTPAAGTVPVAGVDTLTVVFTPTDLIDYTTATASVTITVNPAANVYDAATDFPAGYSAQTNPNGVWSYGYSTGFTNPITLYDLTAQNGVNGVNAQYWLSSQINLGTSPSAEYNNGAAFDDGNVNFLPDEFILVAGIGGQYSNLIFTAPSDGTYSLVSSFRGDQYGVGTVVAVVSGGIVLFNGTVTAEGQTVPFNTDITLKAGDTVVFSVGPGGGLQNTGVSATLQLTSKTSPVITWPAPAAITYGTALGSAQLDATSSVPGSFVYTPAAGTLPGAGTDTLSVTFTPTDTTTYATVTSTVQLTVNQAIPAITWPTPAPVAAGTALSAAQLNATSTVPGTFAYTPPAGTVLTAGVDPLSVTFTPTDAVDYATATATVQITVNLVAPVISWGSPSAITYGTSLSATQLDATSTVPGTFSYTPAAGTVLPAGLQTLSVTFTPTDTTQYSTSTTIVQLTVNKATPAITWPSPASIAYGIPLGAAQLDATSAIPGAFLYTPAAGTVLSAGSNTLSVGFTPTDTVDYTTATATVQLVVSTLVPVITWPTPAPITFGAVLGSSQLDATATIPGTFVYTPAAGAVPAVGVDTLSVTFTPTDLVDYTVTTATTQITVNPAPTVYNVAADFETGYTAATNPNGVWSYGWSAGFTSPITLYDQTVQNGVNGPQAQYWLSSTVNVGTSPAAEYNNGPAYADGNIDFLANDFVLVAGIGGQYADVVFTAPSTGSYTVAATFRGDQNGINTVVGVVQNSLILFNGTVTAVGQLVPFNTALTLNAGDTIVFSAGPNGGSQNTGLALTITGP